MRHRSSSCRGRAKSKVRRQLGARPGDNVAILTDMAIRSDAIDEAEAEEARKQAETRLAEEQLSDEQIAAEQAVIANSVAQLNVKRRRSH